MRNVFFSFIINDKLERFGIIGGLSESEERELTAVMANNHFRRLNCELDRTIEQQVNDFVANNPQYMFVPANQVFPDSTHIHITTNSWSSF